MRAGACRKAGCDFAVLAVLATLDAHPPCWPTMLPTRQVCDLALKFGEAGEEGAMSRPFGVALLVAGWDSHGPALYHTDPSGTHTRFDAKAIGAGAEGAQTALQEQFHKNLTLQEGETMAVTILKQVRSN